MKIESFSRAATVKLIAKDGTAAGCELDADLVAAFTDAVGDSGLIPVAVIDRQVVAGTNAKQMLKEL